MMRHNHPYTGWGVRMTLAALVTVATGMRAQTLQEVTVTARQATAPSQQRIDSTMLQSLNAHSVADVLRYAQGVQVKDYGGVGGLKTINVRGMGTEHTAIVYDGVHVMSAQNGQVDLGRYSTDNLRQVSLMDVSNLLSASEGALATTVAFETAEPWRDGLRVKLKGGSFATIDGSTLWDAVGKDVKNSLCAQAAYTSGKFRFHVARRDAYDTTMTRKNGDVLTLRLEDNLWWKGGTAKAYLYYSKRGLPGAVVREEPGRFTHQDRQEDIDAFIQGRQRWTLPHEVRMQYKWKAGWNRTYYLSDPRLDVTTMYVENTYRQTEVYHSLTTSWHSSRWMLSSAVDARHNYLDANLWGFVFPHRLGLYANAVAQYSTGRLTARAMALVQGFNDWTVQGHSALWRFTPAATVAYRNRGLQAELIFKHTVRQPTFNDLYYTFIGNAMLKPEEVRQLMLAVSWGSRWLTLTAKPYFNRTSDKIVAMPTSNQFRWTMMNLGRVETVGVNASAQGSFKVRQASVMLRATYDWTRARDVSDRASTYYGGQIPYIPWHAASLVGNVEWRGWGASASFLYTGERYESSANTLENHAKPWYTTDLSLRRRYRQWQAALEVNNVFNQQYEVVQCYPMPGTNFKATISYEL